MKMQPYMIKDVKASRKRGDDKGEGSSSFAGGAVSSCKKCKDKVAKPGAQYCQGVSLYRCIGAFADGLAVRIQGRDMLAVRCGGAQEQGGE